MLPTMCTRGVHIIRIGGVGPLNSVKIDPADRNVFIAPYSVYAIIVVHHLEPS